MASSISSQDLLRLNGFQRFGYNFVRFFRLLPSRLWNLILKIGAFFKMFGIKTGHFFRDLVINFRDGNWKTRLSYVVMGFSNFAHKQIARGVLLLAAEVVFIFYMAVAGGYWLSMLPTLGFRKSYQTPDGTWVVGDDSFKILLYGVLTIFFIVAFIYTWVISVKQAAIHQKLDEEKKKIANDKDDLKALLDHDFYKTLLALPTVGIIVFTVMPIFFMILVAFTNYDLNHYPPYNLFGWVGGDNFAKLFSMGSAGNFSGTFGEILVWTLIWAFFATFSNYFLGMLVAMLINRKGIKLKKVWRTILVLTVTIPQFISLLYVSRMFGDNGIVNGTLKALGLIQEPIKFWKDGMLAKVMVIIINIWIGIPYLMLMITGILMNIPADLYESAKIDGANPVQQYFKITLPYILFVTGPYLLTSFTGNMNNFNVIFLLSGGGPADANMYHAGKTDLLITWLYSLTAIQQDYALASVVGIMVFVVVALISLIVYNLLPSNRNEEDLA